MDTDFLTVALDTRSYEIRCGAGVLDDLSVVVSPDLRARRAFIITDRNVAPVALARVKAAWGGACHELILPAGEESKSTDNLYFILSWMLGTGIDRGSVVIALGGGVIGDIAGLAAALVLRGVPYIQIPTSLLAMVDSAVGGKTAVNMPQGKNLVGAFHQPALVVCDTAVLQTLPDREMRAGYAEILKYALIDDPSFFEWLETHGDAVLARDAGALRYAVLTCCRKKAAIVAADERDTGQRMLLNLGHTFAHGIEAAAGYDGRVLHGEAVAAGMVLAFRLSQVRGYGADPAPVAAHLEKRGLAPDWRTLLPESAANDIMAAMEHDKKAVQGYMTFVMARGIGRAFIDRTVTMNDVAALLRPQGE